MMVMTVTIRIRGGQRELSSSAAQVSAVALLSNKPSTTHFERRAHKLELSIEAKMRG